MYHIKPNHLLLKKGGARNPVFAKPASAILALVVAMFVAARVWHLTVYSLWGGESFGIYGARQDWSGLISYAVADAGHPPLFYALLKLWMAMGGESLLWLKLLPVMIAIASVAPFLLLCRELNLQSAEVNLAITLVAVNGFLIHFAQEVRGYSLLMFLSVCSFWLFVRFLNSEPNTKRDLQVLFAVNLALVYTHYFGWLAVGLEFIFLFFWGRRKLPSFFLSVVVLILCFSPWAYAVTEAVLRKQGLSIIDWIQQPDLSNLRHLYAVVRAGSSIIDWIPRPNLFSFAHLYATLNGRLEFYGSSYLGLVLFGTPVLLWGWHTVSGRDEDKGSGMTFWWLFLVSILSVVLMYAASRRVPRSLWVERYFIFMVMPYMILVAIAVNRLRPSWLRTATVLCVVVWSTLAGYKEVSSNRIAWEGGQMGSRIAWEALVRQMIQAEPSQAGDIKIYTLATKTDRIEVGHWTIAESMRFYSDSLNEGRFQVVEAGDVSTLLSTAKENHFWVAFFESRQMKEHPPQKALTDNRYQVGGGFQFGQLDDRLLLFPVWRQ